MSYHTTPDPDCTGVDGSIELLIEGQPRDLGGFTVRRVLPSSRRRMVGPFIFLDEMGPSDLAPGQGLNVRPHPHIGLATITYLFEGEILHRDSLGSLQAIRPGAVNLMTAGRGIVHSERPGSDLGSQSRLHGMQSWIALPDEQEECEPAFAHYPADAIPTAQLDGGLARIIIGEAFGQRSPVQCPAPALYVECQLDAGATLPCPSAPELGIYVVRGSVRIGDQCCEPGTLAVLEPGRQQDVCAVTDAVVMVLGGTPVGPRLIWWNFVSSDANRIETAKRDWTERRFADVPGDDEEWIPLPAL